jgi:hypothetical protein
MPSSPIHAGVLVVTSISGPNPVLKALADGAQAHRVRFIVVGDSKSPAGFQLPGAEFLDLEQQRALPFGYAKVCLERSYTRKNIGYLLAIAGGARFIFETDDDNFPQDEFWAARDPDVTGHLISGRGWANAYRYFSDSGVYPRGFPLQYVRNPAAALPQRTATQSLPCLIQQGLADDNPDVDAIYRLLLPLPLRFRQDPPIILDHGRWCPFNSQNTTTFPVAYPLLYLPAHCTFRMTDIWRSLVAQRILWSCDGRVSFHAPTVRQDRNEHDLLRDFADEVPGYLHNARIVEVLGELNLPAGPEHIPASLVRCYEALVQLGVVAPAELPLLEAWLADLRSLGVLT